MSCAKTVEPIEMQFKFLTCVVPRNHVSDKVEIPHEKGQPVARPGFRSGGSSDVWIWRGDSSHSEEGSWEGLCFDFLDQNCAF